MLKNLYILNILGKYKTEIIFYSKVPEYKFIQSDKGVRCSKRDDKVLKQFLFPSKFLTNASIALTECKIFCGSKNDCWGCSIDCNQSCHWNAIPECGNQESWNGMMIGDISQKPGKWEFLTKTKIFPCL